MPRNDLIQVRRDTAANWTSANPTLASGEIGFETDTGKLKIGNGSTAWSALSYANSSVGGSENQVIYKDGTNTATGSADFTYDNGGTGNLVVTNGQITSSGGTVLSDTSAVPYQRTTYLGDINHAGVVMSEVDVASFSTVYTGHLYPNNLHLDDGINGTYVDIDVNDGISMVSTSGSIFLQYGEVIANTINIDGGTLKVDNANNRVGVGTTSPATALDVRGTVTARATATQDGVALAGRAGGSSTYEVTLTPTTLTADRTLTLPNSTGTVATTANIGLVYITSGTFSGSSAVSINNCFSSTYTNYRVVFGNITHSTTMVLRIRMRASGSDSTSSSWDYAYPYLYASGGTIATNTGTGQTGLYVGDTNSSSNSVAAFSFDVYQPNEARRTAWLGNAINIYTNFFTMSGGGVHNVETAYDGFTLYTSTGTISGNYQVFGYTK